MKIILNRSFLLKPRFIITALLLLGIFGIICRYLFIADVASQPLLNTDLSKTDLFIYDLKAQNTLREDPLDFKMIAYPLYIQFMSFIYKTFGTNPLPFYVVHLSLSIISVFLLIWTGAIIFGILPGIISGLLLLFYKMSYVYDAIKLHTSLSQFLLITTFFFFVIHLYKPSWRYYLGYLVYGVSLCLLRVFFWFLFIPGTIYLCIKNRYWKKPLYILLFLIFSVSSFFLYDYFHAMDSYGQKFGIHFFIGNNSYANGLLKIPPGFCPTSESFAKNTILIAHAETGSTKNINKFWIQKTFESYQGHKRPVLKYLKLLGRKINILVNNMEFHNNTSVYYMEEKTNLKYLPRIDFITISSFALIGMLFSFMHKKPTSFLLLPILLISLMLLSIFLCARYRMPLIPFLCLFAGYGITQSLETIKARKYFTLGLIMIILSATWAWSHIKLPYFDVPEQLQLWKARDGLMDQFYEERATALADLARWDQLEVQEAISLTDRLGELSLFFEFFDVYDTALSLAGDNNWYKVRLLKRKAAVYEEMFNFYKAKTAWQVLKQYPGYEEMADKKIHQLTILGSVLEKPRRVSNNNE